MTMTKRAAEIAEIVEDVDAAHAACLRVLWASMRRPVVVMGADEAAWDAIGSLVSAAKVLNRVALELERA